MARILIRQIIGDAIKAALYIGRKSTPMAFIVTKCGSWNCCLICDWGQYPTALREAVSYTSGHVRHMYKIDAIIS